MTIPLLILAGGRATRLGTHSDDRPKFLMPLGDGRVFADLQLAWVREQGFTDVTLSVGYLAQMIRDYVGDGSRWQLNVRYSEDGDSPLGTGGALKKAMKGACAMLYGDTMLDLPCREVIERARGAHALMTVITSPPGEKSNAKLLPNRNVRYDKRTPDPSWTQMDYGFSVLSEQFVAELPDTTPFDVAEAFMRISKEDRLVGWEASVMFREINTPEALDAFRTWAATKVTP